MNERVQRNRYVDELFRLSCSADLLCYRLFPNGKELTEVFAAYAAVRDHLPEFSFQDRDVTLVAVGDGYRPAAAATFAFRSAWRCHSVDPNLARTHHYRMWRGIDRLKLHPARIEDVRIKARRAVIVAVHSHANLEASLASVDAPEVAIVAMPCCANLHLGRNLPDLTYQDEAITSPCRTVHVWRNARAAIARAA